MDKIQITVTAPTQSGKSIILAQIEKALRELGIRAILKNNEIEKEIALEINQNPPEHMLEHLRSKVYVELVEVNVPRSLK